MPRPRSGRKRMMRCRNKIFFILCSRASCSVKIVFSDFFRQFPLLGNGAPGARCGHTLTAIAGPDGDLSKARLVLFGESGHQERVEGMRVDGATVSEGLAGTVVDL